MMTSNSSGSAQIRVDQVSFAPALFRDATASKREAIDPYWLLQDLAFDVFPGDRIAIVGASGSGKTTLLRLLNRLSEPTKGNLYFNQQNYRHIPSVQLRQQLVLVLQESKLLGMTVQDALSYPLQLRGMTKQAIQQRVGVWIERMHIPLEWLERTELQLSVGQRQWVAIARAMVIQPPVLLLDEPTSALDGGRVQQLFDLLTELSDRSGTTVLMVNHQLDLAHKFSSRILHLRQGRLLQDRSATEIDWVALEQNLQVAEQDQAEEWG